MTSLDNTKPNIYNYHCTLLGACVNAPLASLEHYSSLFLTFQIKIAAYKVVIFPKPKKKKDSNCCTNSASVSPNMHTPNYKWNCK